MVKLNAKELRTLPATEDMLLALPKHQISIILDNVLDTYNVGAIFRLADAVSAECVYLCGETLTPPNSRIKKASINTWQWVQWEYAATAVDAINRTREKNPDVTVVAVEQDNRSQLLSQTTFTLPIALVVGHETHGVSQSARDAADLIVELPMWGINVSLNVMVSCGIVLYEVMRQCNPPVMNT